MNRWTAYVLSFQILLWLSAVGLTTLVRLCRVPWRITLLVTAAVMAAGGYEVCLACVVLPRAQRQSVFWVCLDMVAALVASGFGAYSQYKVFKLRRDDLVNTYLAKERGRLYIGGDVVARWARHVGAWCLALSIFYAVAPLSSLLQTVLVVMAVLAVFWCAERGLFFTKVYRTACGTPA